LREEETKLDQVCIFYTLNNHCNYSLKKFGMRSEFRANYLNVVPTTPPLFGLITVTNSKLHPVNKSLNSMYIHGGRDLKEGTISTMWRVNLASVQQLLQGASKTVGWEQVSTTGKDIGKISHHSCAMVSAKEVGFFGGMRGEDNNGNLQILNLLTNVWTSVLTKVRNPEVLFV
jgi:hypothetical protein